MVSPRSTLLIALCLALGLSVACGRFGQAQSAQAPAPLTYVAIGASDSVGVGADRPDAEGWVPVLHQALPPGSTLVNLGVSGALLRQALDQQLPVALDSDPDVITVWLAVNDLNARVPLERYSSDLDVLLRTLQEQTEASIFVGNIPDVARLPVYRQVDPELVDREVRRWNAVIAETTARNGAQLVDLYTGWNELAEHPEYVGRDGFHPSSAGHRRIAELFRATLDAHAVVTASSGA
jgi:acyl-CoA thioesterase I